MSKFLENVNKRDFDRRISEVVEMLEEKQLYGTISLIKDLKYYLDLATKEKAHTCNCQHNSNSRENEPCCRCDSRQTNADRIRNMSDEEMAERIASSPNFDCADYCDSFSDGCAFRCNRKERELAVTLKGEQAADFINCITFGKNGEFAEKYLHQGTKIIVEGRWQTGNYTNKDGQKVYTNDCVVERHEFCESRANQQNNSNNGIMGGNASSDSFMSIPDGVADEGLPFN